MEVEVVTPPGESIDAGGEVTGPGLVVVEMVVAQGEVGAEKLVVEGEARGKGVSRSKVNVRSKGKCGGLSVDALRTRAWTLAVCCALACGRFTLR